MTLLRLAYRNVKENRRTFFGFLASSIFAVTVFFLFAAFRALPEVAEGRYAGAKSVAVGLRVCQYLIIAFSLFFTLYSNSAFVKSRKRELGLLTLLGADRLQLSILLLSESMIVALISIVSGLALGALFSRLFVMAIDRALMLPQRITFVIQPDPVVITALAYLALFTLISVVNVVSINTSQVIQLLRAPAKPKTPPGYSRLKVLLGMACLVSGYAVAWVVSSVNVILAFLPVTVIVSIGTHILFTQISVAILQRLQRRKSIYYKNTNLLVISDLVFKMKDNARILAQVAILSAVVLTATGVIYAMSSTLAVRVADEYSRAISFVLPADDASTGIARDFEARLTDAGAKVTDSVMMPVVQMQLQAPRESGELRDIVGLLVDEEDFNRWARGINGPEVHLDYGHVMQTAGGMDISGARSDLVTFISDGIVQASLVDRMMNAGFVLICDSAQFAKLSSALPSENMKLLFSCELSNWKKAGPAEQTALDAIPDGYPVVYSSRILVYSQYTASVSMVMIIAMFVAFLFFLAAGSMLYFRFFLEIQEDQDRYVALRRIGLSWQEIRRIATREMAVLFFTPWIVAFSHQMFAMRSYASFTQAMPAATIMPKEAWAYGAVAAGIFLILQIVYFLLTRAAYLQELAPAVK